MFNQLKSLHNNIYIYIYSYCVSHPLQMAETAKANEVFAERHFKHHHQAKIIKSWRYGHSIAPLTARVYARAEKRRLAHVQEQVQRVHARYVCLCVYCPPLPHSGVSDGADM